MPVNKKRVHNKIGTRKILLSCISGFVILLITWAYQNYNFSLSVEDGFFRKLSFWKYKVFSTHPKKKVDFLFINTGKDLTIVDDSTEYGGVAISDREKIYNLLRIINSKEKKPLYLVVDIQFYYPYSIDRSMDTLLQNEISKSYRTTIPIVKSADGNYKMPLYKADYGYSDYLSYGSGFNKFKILTNETFRSVPLILNETLDHAVYNDHSLYTTCNGHLCFTALWPTYYLIDKDVKENKTSFTQSYNLGELLIDLEANPTDYSRLFENRIVLLGNFADDNHSTPVGQMSGSILLANIYLSILNKEHFISYVFLLILLLVFSMLSYFAWFSKVPEVKFNFKFIFSPHIVRFLQGYFSYFGSMFILSLLAIFIFNMHVALFFPSLIFAGIEYVSQKKYMPENHI